jgi:Rad3-related DNA helicase
VVPAPFLKPRLEAARSVALFSATLSPQRFYADTLGLPDDTAWIDVPTPFSADQLQVQLAGHISTRYQHRDASLAPIARLMAQQYAAQPGNYLAFFSSYDYLQKAVALFANRRPACRCGSSRAAWTRQHASSFSSASRPTARASASRCSAARSPRASTCRAGG